MTSVTRAPNFDRVARIYRWAEYLALGPLLQRTRTHFLPELLSSNSAFVIGDGDGRFLAQLLASNITLRALAVDSSERMLALLQKNCASAGTRLLAIQASALDIAPPSDTDLVVTHFFLDCLSQGEVETLIQNTASRCQPGTLWLVSDFQVPSGTISKRLASAYIRLLYLAFKVLTGLETQKLPQHRGALLQAGFTRVSYHARIRGMLFTELWRLDRKR